MILEKRGQGKRDRETDKDSNVRETSINCLLYMPRLGDLNYYPGMCLEHGLNLQPFGIWDDAPTTKPTSQGKMGLIFF